jgi:hypothetical protein
MVPTRTRFYVGFSSLDSTHPSPPIRNVMCPGCAPSVRGVLTVDADPDDGPAHLELAATLLRADVAGGAAPSAGLDVDPFGGQGEIEPVRTDPELLSAGR